MQRSLLLPWSAALLLFDGTQRPPLVLAELSFGCGIIRARQSYVAKVVAAAVLYLSLVCALLALVS